MEQAVNQLEALSLGRYVEKICKVSGDVRDEPIQPPHLLVSHHRDHHVMDILARCYLSRVVAATGDERSALRRVRGLRRLGRRIARLIGAATGGEPAKVARALFGLEEREHSFRYRKSPVRGDQAQRIRATLQRRAAEQLASVTDPGGGLRLKVLLTGGTGFIGKEIMWQAAHDPDIAEMMVLIRPKELIDRETGEIKEVLSPARRGEELLRQLSLDGAKERNKFRFIAGDVEQPNLGISEQSMARIRRDVTHVIHCAASVAFDDPYDRSFRANVGGALNALAFSHRLQCDPASPFVAHLAIETSYLHGRQAGFKAPEGETAFPRDFFNNYYELTKAIASLETERYVLEMRLRAIELCPAIVIGDGRTGNNRGDTKVVNAPVNLFGQAREMLKRKANGTLFGRLSMAVLARLALVFPADATAQLNLIPVDWVARGVISALKKPHAVGHRIHLATDRRVSAQQLKEIIKEELGVRVRLADPTLHRNVTLPLVCGMLKRVRQERVGRALQKLGTIFSGYSEWGQPVHEVGRDAAILGMPADRPVASNAFRMLCRHNQWVQEFGRMRDAGEIARREKVWEALIGRIERKTGSKAAEIPPKEFSRMVARMLNVKSFELTDDRCRSEPRDFHKTYILPHGLRRSYAA